MLDYCGICGESYDEDNLAHCKQCGRDYCYKCSGFDMCKRCFEKKEQAEKQESTAETTKPGLWRRLFGSR